MVARATAVVAGRRALEPGGPPVAADSRMRRPLAGLRALTRPERVKAAILSSWFFVLVTTLWLLKPVRQASLLSHLGARELPYARFGSAIVVGVVVVVYSRLVDRLTRLQVAKGGSLVFAVVLFGFWLAMWLGGDALGGQRWFVWAVFILVDIFSTVMIGIFWTYTNDVVSPAEADKLYGPIGLGGILGGIAGGALVDALVAHIGNVDLLLVCAVLMLGSAGIAWRSESVLRPAPRPAVRERKPSFGSAFEGARLVAHSRYLVLLMGIVVAYEFAAAVTDFVVSVVFEHAYPDQTVLAEMFGRLGWIVSGTALIAQLVLVPLLLPRKRVALVLPPLAMGLATLGFGLVPVVALAVVMATSDRGLNYSLQQVTKETLYVPLGDAEKYKAKAFLDMFVDRAAKAASSIALIIVIAASGVSIPISIAVALVAILLWAACALALGPEYQRRVGVEPEGAAPRDELAS
jgi:AAA family ATP:ADP antiporter